MNTSDLYIVLFISNVNYSLKWMDISAIKCTNNYVVRVIDNSKCVKVLI